MKNLMAASITVIVVLLVAGFSFAEIPGTINLKDLEGLTSSTRKEIIDKKLKELKATSVLSNIDPDKAEKWAKIISGTIKTISKDLSLGVNEFVRTDVGKITMFLIVYKVIGDDIRAIVFGLGAWLFVTPILLISFRYFHGSQKFKIKDTEGNVTDIKYIPRYKWHTCADGSSSSI